MSDIFGSENGLAAGIYREVLNKLAEGGSTPTMAAGSVNFTQIGTGAVARNVADKLAEVTSVTDFGAKGDGSDDIAAVLKARAHSTHMHFPRLGGVDTVYTLGAFAVGALDGAIISADTGVQLSLAANAPYDLYKNITFESDVFVKFRDINSVYVFPKTPSRYKKDSLKLAPPVQRRRVALDATNDRQVAARRVEWPDGDTFSVAAATRQINRLTFPGDSVAAFRGPFVDLGPFETVSAYFDAGATAGPIGVMVRGTNGYSVIYGTGGQSNYFTGQKPVGAPVVGNAQDLSWAVLGQGSYASYQAENSVWSITRTDHDRVVVKLNGRALTQPDLKALGDVVEVGFVCFTAAAFSVSGLTVERRTDMLLGAQELLGIHIFGNSLAAPFAGSWDQYIAPLIDGVGGLKLGSVTNFAVAGSTLAQAYAEMQTRGFGSSHYVIVQGIENDVQGGVSLADFTTLCSNVLDLINAADRIPVIVGAWLWQPAGADGQATNNSAGGAPYRMIAERLAVQKNALFVNPCAELASPTNGGVMLRDRIHETTYAYQMMALITGQALIDHYLALPGSVESAANPDKLLNGATDLGDFRFMVDRDGIGAIGGTLGVTTVAEDTELVEFPAWCRPQRSTNFCVQALSLGGAASLGTAYLFYDANTRRARLRNAPVGTRLLMIAGATFKAA